MWSVAARASPAARRGESGGIADYQRRGVDDYAGAFGFDHRKSGENRFGERFLDSLLQTRSAVSGAKSEILLHHQNFRAYALKLNDSALAGARPFQADAS